MALNDTLFLKSVNVLGVLEHDQLQSITPEILKARYKAGQTIVVKGEISAGFHIVKNGRAAMYAPGNSEPMAVLKKGDFYGALSIFSRTPSAVSLKAMEDDTEVVEIPGLAFDKLLKTQPQLKNSLLEHIKTSSI